mgnify:CR=1 FL=1
MNRIDKKAEKTEIQFQVNIKEFHDASEQPLPSLTSDKLIHKKFYFMVLNPFNFQFQSRARGLDGYDVAFTRRRS